MAMSSALALVPGTLGSRRRGDHGWFIAAIIVSLELFADDSLPVKRGLDHSKFVLVFFADFVPGLGIGLHFIGNDFLSHHYGEVAWKEVFFLPAFLNVFFLCVFAALLVSPHCFAAGCRRMRRLRALIRFAHPSGTLRASSPLRSGAQNLLSELELVLVGIVALALSCQKADVGERR